MAIRHGDSRVNGSILVRIHDGRVEVFLNCDTYEEQEALEPVVVDIRRMVEEALASVEVAVPAVCSMN